MLMKQRSSAQLNKISCKMKTFLILLCIFIFERNLIASAQSELSNQTYTDLYDVCGDYKDLEGEIKALKTLIQEKFLDPVIVTEKPSTTCVIAEQLKTDIESLKGTMTTLLNKNVNQVSGGDNALKELLELIRSKSNFIDQKFFALEIAQNKKNALIDELNENVKELQQKLGENQQQQPLKPPQMDSMEQIQQIGKNILNVLNTKFAEQEIELKSLKAQNEQQSQALKELKELLSQQTPQLKTHADKIQIIATEHHEGLKNHLNHLNETLIEQFSKHGDKLNEHENLLKVIRAQNAGTQVGIESTSPKQLYETLIARFDEMERKKIDSANACSDDEPLNIAINIVDSDY